jgi:hypothetical protein
MITADKFEGVNFRNIVTRLEILVCLNTNPCPVTHNKFQTSLLLEVNITNQLLPLWS